MYLYHLSCHQGYAVSRKEIFNIGVLEIKTRWNNQSSTTQIIAFPPSPGLLFLLELHPVQTFILIPELPHFHGQQVFLSTHSDELILAFLHFQRAFQQQILQVPNFLAQQVILACQHASSFVLQIQRMVFPMQIIDNEAELILFPHCVDPNQLDFIFELTNKGISACNFSICIILKLFIGIFAVGQFNIEFIDFLLKSIFLVDEVRYFLSGIPRQIHKLFFLFIYYIVQVFDILLLVGNDVLESVRLALEGRGQILQLLILYHRFMESLILNFLQLRFMESLKTFLLPLSVKLNLLDLPFKFNLSIEKLPTQLFVIRLGLCSFLFHSLLSIFQLLTNILVVNLQFLMVL